MKISYKFVLSFLLLFILFSCSDSGTNVTDDPDSPGTTDPSQPTAESCDNISITVGTGLPASYVEISGLSSDFGSEPLAWFYDASWYEENGHTSDNLEGEGITGVRNPSFVEREHDSGDLLAIPIHPSLSIEGGDVRVVILSENMEIACNGIAFTISALEAAPGAIESSITSMDSRITALVRDLGLDEQQLLSTPVQDLDPQLMPLALLLQGIRGPNNPNNLNSLLNGSTTLNTDHPIPEGSMEIMDAIYHTMGISEGLDQLIDEVISLTGTEMRNQNTNLQIHQPDEQAQRRFTIQSPGFLDSEMQRQARYESLTGDVENALWAAAGLAIGVAGFLVPGAQIPAAVAGLHLTLAKLLVDIQAGVLPKYLEDMTLVADPNRFNEDFEGKGEWNAQLSAVSEGLSLNLSDALGVILGTFGLGKATTAVRALKPLDTNVLDDAADFVQESLLNMFSLFDDTEVFSIEPIIYGPLAVDVQRQGENEFFIWKWIPLESEFGGVPFAFDSSNERFFDLKETGSAYLDIQTSPEKFQDEVSSATELVQTNPITIEISEVGTNRRSPFFVGPDSDFSINLQARVENAEDETLEWSWEGDGEGFLSWNASNSSIAEFFAPEEEGSFRITAESTSRKGLRADNNPVRSETVFVAIGNLFVGPSVSCVEVNQSLTLQARIGREPVDFNDLNWSINGPGSISEDGVYQSDSEGDVEIEFTLKENDSFTFTLSFEVRDECVGYKFTGAGDLAFTEEGTCGAFLPDGYLYIGEWGSRFRSTLQFERLDLSPFDDENTDSAEYTVAVRNSSRIELDGTVLTHPASNPLTGAQNRNELNMTVRLVETEETYWYSMSGTLLGTYYAFEPDPSVPGGIRIDTVQIAAEFNGIRTIGAACEEALP